MAQIIKVTGETKQVEPQNGTDFKLKELQEIVGGYIGLPICQTMRLWSLTKTANSKVCN